MSSGDVLADRRFTMGEAFAAEGDAMAAADLFEQTLERVPAWAPAWLALGLARERLGRTADARLAYERAAALDGAGTLGAELHRARMEGVAKSMPANFIRALFDGYADRFEAHLAALNYRGPALIADALRRADATSFGEAFDLGCGTGLMARQLQGQLEAIDGVDLSPRMLDHARQTGLYRHLEIADIADALARAAVGSFDLVTAADVFVYLGRLDGICHAAARVLRPGGWLAFTVQSQSGPDDFTLGEDMRFSHAKHYTAAVLAGAGFDRTSLDEISTRDDRGTPVPGLVAVARKA